MALATIESIRDRIATLLEGLTPTTLPRDKLRRWRHEDGARFDEWAEQNSAAAFRRFWIREVSDDSEPDVSNTTEETAESDIEIRIAYPQDHRAGPANALDRDDARKNDWKQIKQTIGINGRSNFSSTNDCTPLSATATREQGQRVDFSVIRVRVRYWRSTS